MGTAEPRHQQLGTPLSEWIQHRADELAHDEVGFWQIVPEGRNGFGLAGADLDEFVRRTLLSLFAKGAVPVRHVRESGRVWTWQKSYGASAEEMAEAIVREWVREGRPDPDLGDLWFGLKDTLDRAFVQKS
jgi:hypothetical protein